MPTIRNSDQATLRPISVTLKPPVLRALSTGVQVVVPRVGGYIIIPQLSVWDRKAGAAYTLNAVTHLTLNYGSAAGIITQAVSVTGLVDQALATTALNVATGSNISAYVAFSAAQVAAAVGQPLVISRVGGTDLSLGGGDLVVTCWYRLLRVPQIGGL